MLLLWKQNTQISANHDSKLGKQTNRNTKKIYKRKMSNFVITNQMI